MKVHIEARPGEFVDEMDADTLDYKTTTDRKYAWIMSESEASRRIKLPRMQRQFADPKIVPIKKP